MAGLLHVNKESGVGASRRSREAKVTTDGSPGVTTELHLGARCGIGAALRRRPRATHTGDTGAVRSDRHRYIEASDRYGRHRSPIVSTSAGFGSAGKP
jgi:hypothetical protein